MLLRLRLMMDLGTYVPLVSADRLEVELIGIDLEHLAGVGMLDASGAGCGDVGHADLLPQYEGQDKARNGSQLRHDQLRVGGEATHFVRCKHKVGGCNRSLDMFRTSRAGNGYYVTPDMKCPRQRDN